MSPRPWLRRRRRVWIGALIGIGVLALAFAAVVLLPAFSVKSAVVAQGSGYVDRQSVARIAGHAKGDSLLLAPTRRIEGQIESEVPGVKSATVTREWPSTLRVSIEEREPIATIQRDGSTAVIDEEGKTLPPAAAKGKHLVALALDAGAKDAPAATEAMLTVAGSLPPSLHSQVSTIHASTASDVSLEITAKDGKKRTVVWGDAEDGELKAKAVAALLSQPGTVIDVSSPVAPVTR